MGKSFTNLILLIEIDTNRAQPRDLFNELLIIHEGITTVSTITV